jgi:hypothetical protein
MLMSNQKSFSAYRLALANSGTNMVPYLGVHLQDITVVNEVKKDMRDGKVNWSKFSQMGRSAAVVLDCARVAPRIEVELKVEGCILGVPLLGEEVSHSCGSETSCWTCRADPRLACCSNNTS